MIRPARLPRLRRCLLLLALGLVLSVPIVVEAVAYDLRSLTRRRA